MTSHYTTLSLPPTLPTNPTALIRRAYHRALLLHHPDKHPISSSSTPKPKTPTTPIPPTPKTETPTVDAITEAFRVLSNPVLRAEYDRMLRLQRAALSNTPNTPKDSKDLQDFQTGIESIDLDDLDCHDTPTGTYWSRSCRCGNARGFVVTEHDLDAAADQGELIVGCLDCSLWIKVHFAVAED